MSRLNCLILVTFAIVLTFFVTGIVHATDPYVSEYEKHRAWRESNGYSKFKMSTISRGENESIVEYNKWVREKEERAKRRWIKRCEAGTERDCWKKPERVEKKRPIQKESNKPHKDELREKNSNRLHNKNKGNSKPVDTGPIRKEKVNGVWRYSNTE